MNKMYGVDVPNVTFKTRVRDESIDGPNPFRWEDLTTREIFANKRVVVFSLPGAFTPTCSTYQLPGFETSALEFSAAGIDSIYCVSVNDSFVMNKWAATVIEGGLQNVKVIPDGSGKFTEKMGMLVDKDNVGFGKRSWRYAMVVDDGVIEYFVEEPGREHNCETDPYGATDPKAILAYVNDKT
jgi:peroxiredoxin|tara:strand:- start:32 stop:580 length:549 start_codon:yes stop_codon:yes gene_type:complete